MLNIGKHLGARKIIKEANARLSLKKWLNLYHYNARRKKITS